MNPLDLTKTPEVLRKIRVAETLTSGGLHQDARDAASLALLELAEAMGIDEAGQELIRILVVQSEGFGAISDYELAHVRGQVLTEVNGEPRILPLAELRTMLRKESTWRL